MVKTLNDEVPMSILIFQKKVISFIFVAEILQTEDPKQAEQIIGESIIKILRGKNDGID
jgi:hypothetical protein